MSLRPLRFKPTDVGDTLWGKSGLYEMLRFKPTSVGYTLKGMDFDTICTRFKPTSVGDTGFWPARLLASARFKPTSVGDTIFFSVLLAPARRFKPTSVGDTFYEVGAGISRPDSNPRPWVIPLDNVELSTFFFKMHVCLTMLCTPFITSILFYPFENSILLSSINRYYSL